MQAKKASRRQLDQAITRMIRKSDKAPPGFHKRIRGVAQDTAKDLKVKGKKFKIPWGLLLIVIPVLVILYLIITRIKRPEGGITPGEELDEPIDLKGREADDLLKDFGYGKPGKGGKGGGRPFDN